MRIVWLSASVFGHALLRTALRLRPRAVVAVVTLSPAATTTMYDGVPLARWQALGLPVHPVHRINDAGPLLRRLKPDLVVMCGWRQIVPPAILRVPRLGFVGFHPTRLPYGRGPAPLINTILCGLTRSAVTLYAVAAGVDSGDIMGQAGFSIAPADHVTEVYAKTVRAGRRLLRRCWPGLVAGTFPRTPQDPARAVVFTPPDPALNRLDPARDSRQEMRRRIRAFSRPYRGAYLEANGQRKIIWRVRQLPAAVRAHTRRRKETAQ